MTHWILILVAAGSNVALNLFLRQGARGLNTTAGFYPLLASLVLSPAMWLAVASAVVLLGSFMWAIRLYSLSLTYTAVTALAIVALTVIGGFYHQEELTTLRLAGLTLIVVGLFLSTRAV